MKKRKNYTRQELVNAIYCSVIGSEVPMTRLMICRAIGRAKSPHILKVIDALVEGGWLVREMDSTERGEPVWYYSPGRSVLDTVE